MKPPLTAAGIAAYSSYALPSVAPGRNGELRRPSHWSYSLRPLGLAVAPYFTIALRDDAERLAVRLSCG